MACRKLGARAGLSNGNSGNLFIKDALECYLGNKNSYLKASV